MTENNKEWEEVQGGTIHRFEEDNTTIEGTLMNKQKGRFEHDDYLIEKEDKTTALVFGGTVLTTKMANVKIGDAVRITRLGKVKSEIGRDYFDFKVEIQKNTG
ncbi:hypothetical protein LCGC14_0485070 [marine sediment metagenome]|uniref:DUF5666 domain-containing protein n=1 Tax=marine sediment metagenome TaxID=412755 RepID=A0A0F9SDL7_9ZZZZ